MQAFFFFSNIFPFSFIPVFFNGYPFLVASPVPQKNELRGSNIRDSGAGRQEASQPIIAEGYLKKKGEQNPIWKRRWFQLRDHVLYYYEDQRRLKLLGTINLGEALLIRVSPPSSHFAQTFSIWRYSN